MKKETPNLAWSCLSKKARQICRNMNRTSGDGNVEFLLDELFGHHNLTSGEEPSELLFVERKKVQELRDNFIKDEWYERAACLEELFGDKLLPDKSEIKEEVPKFNKGDYVKIKDSNVIMPLVIEGVFPNKLKGGHIYTIEGAIGMYRDEDLELFKKHSYKPYKESSVQVEPKFNIGDKVRVKGDTKVREIYRILSNGCIMFGNKGNTYLAKDLELVKPETKEKENKEEKSGNNSEIPKLSQNSTKNCDKENLNSNYDNMEEKELNLCELLHLGDKVYTPMFGYGRVDLVNIIVNPYFCVSFEESAISLSFCSNGIEVNSKGKPSIWPSEELYEKYPLTPYAAWMEWKLERTPRRWRAEEGQKYWFIDSNGDVGCTVDQRSKFTIDKTRYEFGNYFRTTEEANQAAEAVRECLMKFHEKISAQNLHNPK